MKGDFSVLHFDPHEHDRGVVAASDGVLRNLTAVLYQQGRVMRDGDLLDGELFDLEWQAQAGRDVIGAGVAAVPAAQPDGFSVASAQVVADEVRITVRPGRVWADGLLTHLAGSAATPTGAVERTAAYFGPPIATALPTPDSVADDVRDAVVLEVSEEAIHGFQYPDALIEPALGGPDTAERAYVKFTFRLLRLVEGEDCNTIRGRLADDPAAKGRLTVSLAPPAAIPGDCPVVGGGGYTGFEHFLYRVEVADTADGVARFKWSQWNGGLVGRGRFDSTASPARVIIDAGRASIVNAGVSEFYLEALQYDGLAGCWHVVYGAAATLNTDNDLELATAAGFGAIPTTTEPVFFRLWNGIANIADFTNAATPRELRDGIRLVFAAATTGNYRPGDYWSFAVRAGEITNPQTLIDDAPPVGVVYHRVPLAIIHWTGRRNTALDGWIEDCRRRFRPLTNQKVCCTFLVGDGVSTFGDFNSLEEAAAHLPAGGGELCLLQGIHRTNLLLDGRRNVTIHGCARRTLVLPRTETRTQPIIRLVDCVGVHIRDLDLVTYDGIPVVIEGREEGSARDIRVHDTRMIGRVHAIRATNSSALHIARNRLHLLDTADGRATISVATDDSLIERNTLAITPVQETTTPPPDGGDPTRDPADPCADPIKLYARPKLVLAFALAVWTLRLVIVPKRPFRALGGIHVRAGSERVRILENTIVGGAGNGITLGGELDPPPPPPPVRLTANAAFTSAGAPPASADGGGVAITVRDDGLFLGQVQDEAGKPVPDVDVYLEGPIVGTDRSDAQGLVSIKARPGPYTLEVTLGYRVVRVAETPQAAGLLHVITVAARTPTDRAVVARNVRGFLYEITIDTNDISMMGLSGIGFATTTREPLRGGATPPPPTDARSAIIAQIDALVAAFAFAELFRVTDPVRDLVVRGNRIHHCLRNPFDDSMRREALLIGRGGVSLALVQSAVISENHIYENGPTADIPVCGVFIGYGDDLEITDNVIGGNGAAAEPEQNRLAGLRSGIYVRFAGALTRQYSAASGRKPALRVHDNRVDQPAGRALTAFAFGPVSCADNHLNSELTGLFQFLDTAVGAVLILNFGGIHRYLARTLGKSISGNVAAGSRVYVYAVATEQSLPGGETLFHGNYVRLGNQNRSITSQAFLTFDDLGYDGNHGSVFRRDPFFANVLIYARTLRATDSRFREDAARTISLLSFALDMNLSVHNQADHCIVALPKPTNAATFLKTLDVPNQVLDFGFCSEQFKDPLGGVARFLVQVLAASANQLGATVTDKTFTRAELSAVQRDYTARSFQTVGQGTAAQLRMFDQEATRLEQKLGAEHPRVMALREETARGAVVASQIAITAEAARIPTVEPTPTTTAVVGRVANAKAQGQARYVVDLVRANGERVETLGTTDESGAFVVEFDESRTAELVRERALFVRVNDPAGREVFRSKEPLAIAAGQTAQASVVLPIRTAGPSPERDGRVIFDAPPPKPKPTRGTPLEMVKGIGPVHASRLRAAGIADLETLLRTDAETLVRLAGFDATVVKREAEAVLKRTAEPSAERESEPEPTPEPTPEPRPEPTPEPEPDPYRSHTPLDRLEGVDAGVFERLAAAGVADVEGLLALDAASLAKIVGDRAKAAQLRRQGERLVRPAPRAGRKTSRRKKPKE